MLNFFKLNEDLLGAFCFISFIVLVGGFISIIPITESNTKRTQVVNVIDKFDRTIIINGEKKVVSFTITNIEGSENYKVDHE